MSINAFRIACRESGPSGEVWRAVAGGVKRAGCSLAIHNGILNLSQAAYDRSKTGEGRCGRFITMVCLTTQLCACILPSAWNRSNPIPRYQRRSYETATEDLYGFRIRNGRSNVTWRGTGRAAGDVAW